MVEVDTLVLFLIWQEKLSVFLPWSMMLAVGFFTDALCLSKKVPFSFQLLSAFFFLPSWKGARFCIVLFFLQADVGFFGFFLLKWYNVDSFSYNRPTLHFLRKSQLVMVTVLFMCYWIVFDSILLRSFTSTHKRYWYIMFFWCVRSLSNFGMSSTSLIEWAGKFSLLC